MAFCNHESIVSLRVFKRNTGIVVFCMTKYRNFVVDPDKAVIFVKDRYTVFNDSAVTFFDSYKDCI